MEDLQEDRADATVQLDRGAQSRSSAPRVRLSCEACRQRKVKCDKLSPCTSCQRLGFVCVPVERARLPRGRTRKAPERTAGSDKELADRVAKLEQLLKRVAAERENRSTVEETSSAAPSTEHSFETKMADVETWRDQNARPADSQPRTFTLPHRPRQSTTYMASSFWEDIMQQTQELRSVLDDRLESEHPEYKNPSTFGHSFVGSESSESVSNSPQSVKGLSISAQTRRSLCAIYLRNVDPVFKVLHRPSLRAFLHDEKPYLDYEPDHHTPATLALAVYYAAVCTIDETQVQSLFGSDKKTITAELQRETEMALVKAEFMTTNDLTVLQAYVISLLAARCQDQSRRVWTMLSMALRVGQALCLHMREPPFQINAFEQQMRRRCWQAIGLLDIAASLDRASEPMMQAAWLQNAPPANINDEDIWFGMTGPIRAPPEGSFTDMTHTLIIAEAQSVARSIAFADFIEMSVKSMTMRQQILQDFQLTASNLLRQCRPDLSPYQRYVQRTAGTVYSWLQLVCVRPLQRSRKFTPPAVQGDYLLMLAADNLQKSSEAYCDPTMAPWSWFGSLWVPWHGLAVALAELCVCKDADVMTKYWPVVEQMYHSTSTVIADSQHGMLWKPMEKLMNQARTRKRELLGNSESPADPLRHVPVSGIPINPSTAQLNPQPAVTYPVELGPTAGPPVTIDSALAMPAAPTTLEQWPNMWDAMDLSTTGAPAQGDNAWLNYESFLGDVYDSVDTMFVPR
ncbi:uncharacterized protein N7459_001277 [Penicillium hispanicum]|uniref:uncharacterized protein n=1 Tax=Penicillium hispanicum TaxID=1080232 RepID=UPI002540C6B6|nr:uncharacterized protein N7459_001277 [Penicillium hispanicum]KAJ5595069.1 hypothetical protein N7459_001277 [Penicillium hispanicum]